jgi:uncharacterized membrane protein HdeD (DUF308 family)
VLFGLLTFLVPGITLVTLVLLFGAYALADGILSVIAFFRVASHQWALLIEGVIGIGAGVLTFAWPAITALTLLYVIALWAIFTGVFEIMAGGRLRKVIANEWLLLQSGVLSILFGGLILFSPGLGALALVPMDWRLRLGVWNSSHLWDGILSGVNDVSTTLIVFENFFCDHGRGAPVRPRGSPPCGHFYRNEVA